jgi:hypothetical protein
LPAIQAVCSAPRNPRMLADVSFPRPSDNQLTKIRLTHFRNLSELESGVYWPKLQPYFIKPQFRR